MVGAVVGDSVEVTKRVVWAMGFLEEARGAGHSAGCTVPSVAQIPCVPACWVGPPWCSSHT